MKKDKHGRDGEEEVDLFFSGLAVWHDALMGDLLVVFFLAPVHDISDAIECYRDVMTQTRLGTALKNNTTRNNTH